jgi:hypothetical protein
MIYAGITYRVQSDLYSVNVSAEFEVSTFLISITEVVSVNAFLNVYESPMVLIIAVCVRLTVYAKHAGRSDNKLIDN